MERVPLSNSSRTLSAEERSQHSEQDQVLEDVNLQETAGDHQEDDDHQEEVGAQLDQRNEATTSTPRRDQAQREDRGAGAKRRRTAANSNPELRAQVVELTQQQNTAIEVIEGHTFMTEVHLILNNTTGFYLNSQKIGEAMLLQAQNDQRRLELEEKQLELKKESVAERKRLATAMERIASSLEGRDGGEGENFDFMN